MPPQKLTAKILSFLNEYPGASIKDVSSALGISLSMTRTILYRLRNNGYVEKAGSGYYLTSKGEWLLSRILGEKKSISEEKSREEKEEGVEKQEAIIEMPLKKESSKEQDTSKTIELKIDNTSLTRSEVEAIINDKISIIMKKIEVIEEKIKRIEKEIEKLHRTTERQVVVTTNNVIERKQLIKTLPVPVMSIPEARGKLGPQYDKLIYEGKIIEINTIVVDREFYDEFTKKFPLSIKEAEKLPPLERKLLEEMKKDARVILKAGKYYELIK